MFLMLNKPTLYIVKIKKKKQFSEVVKKTKYSISFPNSNLKLKTGQTFFFLISLSPQQHTVRVKYQQEVESYFEIFNLCKEGYY